jgi:hypothetical protein
MISMLQKLRDPFADFGPGADFLYAIDRVRSSLSTRADGCLQLIAQPIRDKPLLRRRSAALQARESVAGDAAMAAMPVLSTWRPYMDVSWSSAVRGRLSLRAGDHDAPRHAKALPHTDVAAGP